VYLILDGQPPNDQAAVAVLRRIAEVAASWNVRVALYPHTGNWVSRVDHAVRLAKLVQRPNFGVIFNLCPWLKNEGPGHLRETLEAALPYLFAVTINGADPAGQDDPDWGRLIQPLGHGTYDVPALLRTLRGLDYHGPIGLMCWAIPGDAQDHLQCSIAAWQQWTGK
jgi:sugar phosphate isomerase/epimerase